MKKYYLIALISLSTVLYSLAQSSSLCACCTANHQAFDFWEGDWTVYDSSGNILGTNEVVKFQDGCVLQENWEGAGSSNTGTSYNFFDASDSTWNQVWISNTGNVLNLKGNLSKEGIMVLKSKLINSSRGIYYNQITWTKNKDQSVTQRWDILDENNEAISVAFEGIYKKSPLD